MIDNDARLSYTAIIEDFIKMSRLIYTLALMVLAVSVSLVSLNCSNNTGTNISQSTKPTGSDTGTKPQSSSSASGKGTIFFIVVDNEAGRKIYNELAQQNKAEGFDISDVEYYQAGKQDFGSIVNKLENQNVSTVWVIGEKEERDSVKSELSKLAIKAQIGFTQVNFPSQYSATPYLANSITSVKFNPESPAVLKYGERVNIQFTYSANEVGGVRIWAFGFSGGKSNYNCAHAGSPLYPAGIGNGENMVVIDSDINPPIVNQIVDSLKFEMWSVDSQGNQKNLLYQNLIPVDYHWRFMKPQYFRANHGFNGGQQGKIDLSTFKEFDEVRTIDDLANFTLANVPNAIGFTAHPDFEKGYYRYASAILWYTNRSAMNMSWPLYLFDMNEAQKGPGP